MKKLLFILIAFLVSSGFAFSQQELGTTPEGYIGPKNALANGLTNIFSVSGLYTISADGAGSNFDYTVDVDKPNALATVYKAYLLGTPTQGATIPDNSVTLAGNQIAWDGIATNSFNSYYKDVTTIIAPIIDIAPIGISSIAVTESSTGSTDGVALLVVFSDPSTFVKTIVIMWGALSTAGDNFSLTLGTPIDPLTPGAILNMGIGIGYSANGPSGGQISLIDINGQRLTSAANGEDDGSLANGALITVGGIGDINDNPPNPYDQSSNDIRYDDELYSLLPLIDNTTTNILVNTFNPSGDDNIFLAYFEISGVAIIGEGIILTQVQNVENLGDPHTVDALVQDDLGDPIAGKQVEFTVLSGPNAGNMFSGTTDANGLVSYTYNGTGGAGVDDIQACFIDSQTNLKCSNTLTVEWGGNTPPPSVPLSDWAIYIAIMLIGIAIFYRFKTRIA